MFMLLFIAQKGIGQAKYDSLIDNFYKKSFLKKKFILPKVKCSSFDTCNAIIQQYDLLFIKWNGEKSDNKQVFINGKKFDIVSLKNKQENLLIDKDQFLDYENSNFYFSANKRYILIAGTLPYCTGIACKYDLIQLLDLKNQVCIEKIVVSKRLRN